MAPGLRHLSYPIFGWSEGLLDMPSKLAEFDACPLTRYSAGIKIRNRTKNEDEPFQKGLRYLQPPCVILWSPRLTSGYLTVDAARHIPANALHA